MSNPNTQIDLGGRPWFDGKDFEIVLSLLRAAWDLGASDIEAAGHANISTSALSRFLDRYPEFREERDRRKEQMILLARAVVMENMKARDSKTAMWYLEKKKRDEFMTRTETFNVNLNVEDEDSFNRLMNTPIDEKDSTQNTTVGASEEVVANDQQTQ